jgi:hypothetical protein
MKLNEMEKESWNTPMAASTKALGIEIWDMERDLNVILTVILTTAISRWVKHTARVFIPGSMAKYMMENGIWA